MGRATPSSQKPAHTSIQFSQLWLLLLESFASLSLKFTTQRSLFMEFSQLPFLLKSSQSPLSLKFIVVFLTGSSAATFLGLFLIHFQDWSVFCPRFGDFCPSFWKMVVSLFLSRLAQFHIYGYALSEIFPKSILK